MRRRRAGRQLRAGCLSNRVFGVQSGPALIAPAEALLVLAMRRRGAAAASADSGRRSVGLCIPVIVVRPPELGEVSAEIQFEVAPNTVTGVTNLRTTRLRTW